MRRKHGKAASWNGNVDGPKRVSAVACSCTLCAAKPRVKSRKLCPFYDTNFNVSAACHAASSGHLGKDYSPEWGGEGERVGGVEEASHYYSNIPQLSQCSSSKRPGHMSQCSQTPWDQRIGPFPQLPCSINTRITGKATESPKQTSCF